MTYKNVDGFVFPDSDLDCAPAMFATVGDLELYYPFVQSFDVAVQAGGNVGIFPAKMAERFKFVYTFEPDAINFNCLCRNAPLENIIKLQAALGEKHGLVGIQKVPQNVGANYVSGAGNVPTLKIDDLNLNTCDMLMLDVEGMELAALKGALGTIMAFHPCIVVEEKDLGNRYGYPHGAIAEFLASIGYREVHRKHRDVVYTCG